MDFRLRLSEDRRKLAADFLNTIAKLFAGGGLVAPFLQQVEIGLLSALGAVIAGVVFHLMAHYILIESAQADDDD